MYAFSMYYTLILTLLGTIVLVFSNEAPLKRFLTLVLQVPIIYFLIETVLRN